MLIMPALVLREVFLRTAGGGFVRHICQSIGWSVLKRLLFIEGFDNVFQSLLFSTDF